MQMCQTILEEVVVLILVFIYSLLNIWLCFWNLLYFWEAF